MNLSTYLKDIQKELKLTTFPGQTVVINFTLFVIIFTAVMAAYLGVLDLGFGETVIQGINAVKTSDVLTATSSLDIASSTASTTSASSSINSIISTSSPTAIPANILVK